MFIGHFGVGLALKGAEKNLSLGLLFLAAVFVDLLWSIFVLLGIEKVNIVPGINAAHPFEFAYYPYSHSLAATFIWAGVVYFAFRLIPFRAVFQNSKAAFVLGIGVLSHFFLDAIVHLSDLPLFLNDSYKIGFGLWNYVLASYVVEGIIFLVGIWIYMRSTTGTTFGGRYGMIFFAVLLLIANLASYREDMLNLLIPFPLTPSIFAISLLGYNLFFCGVAFWLDRKRI